MDVTAACNERLSRFLSHLAENRPLYWKAVEKNRKAHTELFEEFGTQLVGWAAHYLGDDYPKILADGYVSFVNDVNQSQIAYEKRGEYVNKSYEEVFADCYDNQEHMASYHWGVFVTMFAWEHHLQIYRFYRNEFLSLLNAEGGTLLELGSGSGLWGLTALRFLPEWTTCGVDISETSVAHAKRMSEACGFRGRARYVTGDGLSYRLPRADSCISCFLLEHLEAPEKLLANMAANLEGGSYAFVTGALTAAEIDHIKEFKRESELVLMAESAGFRVIATLCGGPQKTYPKDYRFLPRSMALILQRRDHEIW